MHQYTAYSDALTDIGSWMKITGDSQVKDAEDVGPKNFGDKRHAQNTEHNPDFSIQVDFGYAVQALTLGWAAPCSLASVGGCGWCVCRRE